MNPAGDYNFLIQEAHRSAIKDSLFLISKAAKGMGFLPGKPVPLENKPFNLPARTEPTDVPQITGVVSYVNFIQAVLSYNCGNTWLTRLIKPNELPLNQ